MRRRRARGASAKRTGRRPLCAGTDAVRARGLCSMCRDLRPPRPCPRFAGPSALVLIASMASSDDERRQSLAMAERLLAEGCIGHTHLEFYPMAIDGALEQREWAEAERYADALENYTHAEPLPWSRF